MEQRQCGCMGCQSKGGLRPLAPALLASSYAAAAAATAGFREVQEVQLYQTPT